MNIFFDLDGTLIDSRERLYQLFQFLVPQSKFSFDDYWKLKRNKVNHYSMLNEMFKFDSLAFEKFEEDWMKLIETTKYLNYDQPFKGVTDFLIRLNNKNIKLYLVTARQNMSSVKYQINKYGWNNIFTEVLVTQQKKGKDELILPFLDSTKDNWIIGDTGYDIKVGKSIGIKTAAVLSGFLNEEQLSTYQPDLLIESVLQFPIF